ncbi:creatininase family protein [Micromonospora sp. LH3U1]|uniref:creatininase family protein n=1 Tax=Micromonospora sp. LH3U1 TaxID=3018339 RepID=UPI00234B9A81|nr:creatininase family protein [Micromonospora sp. LH3U1]WCN83262.1 creatininase family protein [Micromonospora sp. LH3U1]
MDELIERWRAEGGLLPITRVPGHALANVAEAADLAVLPVGAVEWHGPHLPLGTDLLLAEGFAGELATGSARAVLFPAAPYAACPGQTRPWPGTVALRPEIAVGYLSDVLAGIVEAGFPRLLVVNGHDANLSTVRAAMEWVSGRHLASLLLANWFQLVSPDETGEIFGALPARGHGGAYETSAVLGFDPATVHLGATPDLPPKPKLATTYPYVLVESRPDPWQGWSGHVSLANESAGQRIRQLAGARLREVIEAWLAAPLPGPPGADRPASSDQAAWSDRPDGTGRTRLSDDPARHL